MKILTHRITTALAAGPGSKPQKAESKHPTPSLSPPPPSPPFPPVYPRFSPKLGFLHPSDDPRGPQPHQAVTFLPHPRPRPRPPLPPSARAERKEGPYPSLPSHPSPAPLPRDVLSGTAPGPLTLPLGSQQRGGPYDVAPFARLTSLLHWMEKGEGKLTVRGLRRNVSTAICALAACAMQDRDAALRTVCPGQE